MRALPLCRGRLTPRNVPMLPCVQCDRRWPPKAGEPMLPSVPLVLDGKSGRCDQRVPPLPGPGAADDVSAGAAAPALPLGPAVTLGAGGSFFI